jgi:hypothetical protein
LSSKVQHLSTFREAPENIPVKGENTMARNQREHFGEDDQFERLWDSDSAELDDVQMEFEDFDEDFQIQMEDDGRLLEFDDDY